MIRSDYHNNLETSLNAMNARISRLEAELEGAKLDDKSRFQQLLDDVKEKRDAARAKLQQVGNATDSAWQELKQGLDGAWSELETSYERARSQLVDMKSPN